MLVIGTKKEKENLINALEESKKCYMPELDCPKYDDGRWMSCKDCIIKNINFKIQEG